VNKTNKQNFGSAGNESYSNQLLDPTLICGSSAGMAETPLSPLAFCSNVDLCALHLVRYHAFLKHHPTTNLTEISGLERGKKVFFPGSGYQTHVSNYYLSRRTTENDFSVIMPAHSGCLFQH
jgi:hypothetical protein